MTGQWMSRDMRHTMTRDEGEMTTGLRGNDLTGPAPRLSPPPVTSRAPCLRGSDAKHANYNPVTITLTRPRALLHPPVTSQYVDREITFTFKVYC